MSLDPFAETTTLRAQVASLQNEIAQLEKANETVASLQTEIAQLKKANESVTSLAQNFYGRTLTGADLSRADLSGVDLSYASLRGATLTGANLSKATLTGANLTGVRGQLAAADDITLRTNYQIINNYIVGPKVDLSNADLTNANLIGADLTGATLNETIGTGAILPTGYELDGNDYIVKK